MVCNIHDSQPPPTGGRRTFSIFPSCTMWNKCKMIWFPRITFRYVYAVFYPSTDDDASSSVERWGAGYEWPCQHILYLNTSIILSRVIIFFTHLGALPWAVRSERGHLGSIISLLCSKCSGYFSHSLLFPSCLHLIFSPHLLPHLICSWPHCRI